MNSEENENKDNGEEVDNEDKDDGEEVDNEDKDDGEEVDNEDKDDGDSRRGRSRECSASKYTDFSVFLLILGAKYGLP